MVSCITKMHKMLQMQSDSKILLENFINEVTEIILNSRCERKGIICIGSDYHEILNLIEENEYLIEIHFKRKNTDIRILIERWCFNIVFDKGKIIKNTIKKISTLIRSISTYSRILPAFSFFTKKGFNYELEYNIIINDKLTARKEFYDKKRFFINIDSELNNAKLKINIEFILKSDIFKIEEEMKLNKYFQKINIDKNNHRKRFYSEDITKHIRKTSEGSSKETYNSSNGVIMEEYIGHSCSLKNVNNLIKPDKKFLNLSDSPKQTKKKSYEFISIKCHEDNDYLNISNESYILELDNNENDDVITKFNKLKEISNSCAPIGYNLFEIYKSCIDKQ